MKIITSVTHFRTSEGMRLVMTYSEVDADGNITSQNNKKNIVVLETEMEVLEAIKVVTDFCTSKLPE